MLLFVRSWIFSGPVAGLLGRPAAFREVGCVCLLCAEACFECSLVFVQGLSLACLVGLLLFVKCYFPLGF